MQFAKEMSLEYIEVSVKTGENVEKAVVTCAKAIKEKVESEVSVLFLLYLQIFYSILLAFH